MKYTTEVFIEKAKEKHGDRFIYNKVNYISSMKKVIVTCPTHGDFEIIPASHLRGTGCRGCQYDTPSVRKYDEEYVLTKFKETHGDRYDYSKFKYSGAKTKSTFICKIHGEFEQRPQNHMKGEGCPKCGKSIGRTLKTTTEFINEAKEVHGDLYDYTYTEYKGAEKDVVIECKLHGDFFQNAASHLKGSGCPKCSYIKRGEDRKLNKDILNETILNQCRVLGYTPDSLDDISSVDDKFKVTCNKHGEFLTSYRGLIYNENKCPKCSGVGSSLEDYLYNYFKGRGLNVIRNDRGTLGGREIDLLFPDKKLGVEINGIIWHSTKFGKGSRYHIDKTEGCANKGIDLVHIFEDEFDNSKDIVVSIIENKLGLTEFKVAARDCTLKELKSSEVKEFLDYNHLKGSINSLHNIGLFYKDELISLMTFSNLRRVLGSQTKEGEFELIRFCNKKNYRVLGGASKLLKYFEETYKPKNIISYADLRFSKGELYERLGFKLISQSSPNYFYVKNGSKRFHRYLFRKSELIKQGFDLNKSEREIMEERGFYRIYDCGALKFEKTY